MAHVNVYDLTQDDAVWEAPASQYERILHQLDAGAAWVDFETTDGVDVRLRADQVRAVTYASDAAEDAVQARLARQRMGDDA
jgi:hypothetical protein